MRVKNIILICILLFSFDVAIFGCPLIWKLNSLQDAKEKQSDAVNSIISSAERTMTKNLVTVMDKPILPPSGDKHDYMSMGPYWWPNPDTDDGLPYIRKDGLVNPERNRLDRNAMSNLVNSTVIVFRIELFLTNFRLKHPIQKLIKPSFKTLFYLIFIMN